MQHSEYPRRFQVLALASHVFFEELIAMAKKSGKKAAAPAPTPAAPGWPTVRGATEDFRLGCEGLASQGKDMLSALAAANAALGQAMGRMTLELVGLSRATVESAAATGAGMVDAKSLEDVMGPAL